MSYLLIIFFTIGMLPSTNVSDWVTGINYQYPWIALVLSHAVVRTCCPESHSRFSQCFSTVSLKQIIA